jgi:hypothetical protein
MQPPQIFKSTSMNVLTDICEFKILLRARRTDACINAISSVCYPYSDTPEMPERVPGFSTKDRTDLDVLGFLMGCESHPRKRRIPALQTDRKTSSLVSSSSRRFQFSFTDFSLVYRSASRRYFQGHSP